MRMASQPFEQRTQALNLRLGKTISKYVVTIRRLNICRSVCACLLAVSLPSVSADLGAKVVRILDGHTVELATIPATVLAYESPNRLRLNGIDAPEKKQAFGQRSKQYLADLIGGKSVTVYFTKYDRYHRLLGDISLKECKPECRTLDVNAAMVHAGMAWAYRYHNEATSPKMASLEATARNSKQGLWQEPNPVEPWKWRRVHH